MKTDVADLCFEMSGPFEALLCSSEYVLYTEAIQTIEEETILVTHAQFHRAA